MYKFKNKQTPKIFNDIVKKSVHQYITQFLKDTFSVRNFTKKHKIVNFYQDPKNWNEFLTH